MRFWQRAYLNLLGVFVYSLSGVAFAAPGALATTPLIVTSTATPNVMLMIDNSGSMNAFQPEAPYDPDVVYYDCPLISRVSTLEHINVGIKSDGKAFFATGLLTSGFVPWDWGRPSLYFHWFSNPLALGQNGLAARCFDSDATYSATLYGDHFSNRPLTGDAWRPSTSWLLFDAANAIGAGSYTGNYLNWYFSNADQTSGANFGAGSQRRPGVRTRLEVAQASAKAMVAGMNSVNIGVTTFNNSATANVLTTFLNSLGLSDLSALLNIPYEWVGEGGKLVQPMMDIDTNGNKVLINNGIDSLTAGGPTPLAETFETVGRYFIEGYQGNNLTLHPGAANENSSKTGAEIYSHELNYNGITKPTNTSPVINQYCQKNFLVGVTDGMPTYDSGVDSDLSGYAADGDGYSLTDVALALYDMDLRPDLNGHNGSAVKNNLRTYLVGFADSTLSSDPLMTSTAANGGGSFYYAGSEAALTTALNTISKDIGTKVGTLSSVAFNSSTLQSDSAVFHGVFNTAKWQGQLVATPLSLSGVLDTTDSNNDGIPDSGWEASAKLDAQSTRVMLTHDGSDGVAFNGTPSGSLATDLNVDSSDGSSDSEALDRLNYLRGDRSLEGVRYRSRASRLGDVVNSTPVYVGTPQMNWPDTFGASGNRYWDFKNRSTNPSPDIAGNPTEDGASDRTPVIYVGANDGFLHGFDATLGNATSGQEVLAYSPASLLNSAQNDGLHYLTSQSYDHRYYVDLSPVVSDVFIDSGEGDDWHTVLVGGLRGGGKGLFALDVTNPSRFSELTSNAADTVLWEFTDAADLGYTFSQPSIGKLQNGKWAVIVGNGYNSTNGDAALFIIDIEDGSLIKKISTGVGSSVDQNGLSTPAIVDLDGDSVVDRVYAGDLKGNMWAFDLSSNSTNGWKVAYKTGNGAGAVNHPLFTATRTISGVSTVQPITAAPLVALNLDEPAGTSPNVLVMFGTGQYLVNSDLTDTNGQTFYAVWDQGSVVSSRSLLATRTLGLSSGRRVISGSAIDWSTDRGWLVDLENGAMSIDGSGNSITLYGGERVVFDAKLRRTVLFFNTLIPDGRPCSAGGDSWLMSLDFNSGLAPDFSVFDSDNDGLIRNDHHDLGKIGEKTFGLASNSGFLGDYQYTPVNDDGTGSSDGIEVREVYTGSDANVGNLGWQELTRD